MAVGLALLLGAPALAAQGTCEVNNQAACVVAGGAVQSLTILITPNAILEVPIGNIGLPSPTDVASLETGVGVPVALAVNVKSNGGWSVAVAAGAPTWTGTPGSARQDKPAGELQWGTSVGGPFVALSTTPATVATGVATASQPVALFVRVAFNFELDVAGIYQLPISLILTAP